MTEVKDDERETRAELMVNNPAGMFRSTRAWGTYIGKYQEVQDQSRCNIFAAKSYILTDVQAKQ